MSDFALTQDTSTLEGRKVPEERAFWERLSHWFWKNYENAKDMETKQYEGIL